MKPNIVMILLDGARWDRIDKSNEFEELCQEGTLLNNITTSIPYTVGSINVTFSGLYGKDNGIDAYYKMFRLKESVKILPEVLKENGYFTACDLLTSRILANRGFDVHQAHDEYVDNLLKRHPTLIKEWKKKADNKPFFFFLHFTRIHTVTVSEILKKFEWNDQKFYEQKEKNLENYDDVFLEAGVYAKKIKKTIEDLHTDNETIIIFFSDHGTGIGERFGERNYGSFTFEETIRSFFLFISPRIKKNRKTDKLRETIDIFPTIMKLCGIDLRLNLPGSGFAHYLIGRDELEEKSHTFSETGALHGPYPSPKEPNVFCVKTPKYKLMYLKTPNEWKLFDLVSDPKELNNIIDKEKTVANQLKKKIEEWMIR